MYTSPSPLPRRDPLRLPFSVHIRKLFFLFLSLFSGAPRRTHPVGAGVCPSVCPAVAPFSHPVGAGVLDGPHRFSFMPTAGIFRAPSRQPFAHGGPLIFLFYASGGDISRSGATSFCPRRQKDAKTPPKTHGLWNSFRPLAITAQKSPTTNRLYFYPRCRSHVPQDSAASYRRGTMLRPLLYTAMYHDLKFSAAQRAAHTLAAGGGKCAI